MIGGSAGPCSVPVVPSPTYERGSLVQYRDAGLLPADAVNLWGQSESSACRSCLPDEIQSQFRRRSHPQPNEYPRNVPLPLTSEMEELV